jgi:hypothetical protein
VIESSPGRCLALAGWGVAAAGIVLILACTVASVAAVVPLAVAGSVMVVLGSAGFAVGQLRS